MTVFNEENFFIQLFFWRHWMTRGKWLLTLLIIILAVGCSDKFSPTGPVADTPENRKTAAARYLEAVPPQEMLQSTMGKMAQRLPEPTRKLFLETLADKDLLKQTRRISETALVKHFTPDELNAMTAFFGSAAGKSARKKFSPYMNDIMPQVNAEVKKVFGKLQEQAKKEEVKEGAVKAEQPKAEQPKAEPAKPAEAKPVETKAAKPASPQPQTPQPKPTPSPPEKPKNM
jgi:hypothetical protein